MVVKKKKAGEGVTPLPELEDSIRFYGQAKWQKIDLEPLQRLNRLLEEPIRYQAPFSTATSHEPRL